MIRYLVAILLAFSLSNCVPPPPSVVAPLPEGIEDVLVGKLYENAHAFSSLQGVVKTKIVVGDKVNNSSQALFLQKPAYLRSEVLNPFGFGQPLLTFATDGRDLAVFIPAQSDFFRGEATPENLSRLVPIPLSVEDLVRFLLYDVRMIRHETSRVTSQDGGYLLTLETQEGLKQVFRFDGDLFLSQMEISYGGESLISVRYGKGEDSFPSSVSLGMPPQGIQASLVFSDVETNTDIPPERFTLTPPAGVEEKPFPGT